MMAKGKHHERFKGSHKALGEGGWQFYQSQDVHSDGGSQLVYSIVHLLSY